MKIHRFIGPFDLQAERLLLRDPELVHQIRAVLKLRVGEQAVFVDGEGREARVRLMRLEKNGIEVEVLERLTSWRPARDVTLFCAVLKRENLEYAAQKAVETGVVRVIPVLTARTVKLGLNRERLEKIVKEAAEQSGRGTVPAVDEPKTLLAAMKEAAGLDINLFFDGHGKPFAGCRSSDRTVGVWIGPEGGWEESELKVASDRGFLIVSLGETTLRAETAATIAVYLATR